MISSLDTENYSAIFNFIQDFKKKGTLSKPSLIKGHLNLIVSTKKPAANIILNGEVLNAFPYNQEQGRMFILIALIQRHCWVQCLCCAQCLCETQCPAIIPLDVTASGILQR